MSQLPAIERERFIHQLDCAVTQARIDLSHLGLLLIDLTNLARINHHHGYDAGDLVLKSSYARLLGVSKIPGTIFRVGSHRFAFILPDLRNPAFIALALNRVQRLLGSEMSGGADQSAAEVKIGIAVNREGRTESLPMLASAEASLSQVKLGGTLRMEDVLAEVPAIQAGMQLERHLSEALDDSAFELVYQPKVNLVTGQVENAEALLRWRSPLGEAVSPELIVQWAETAGRSYDLTKWVVHRALRQIKDWQSSLDIGLALNVPANLVGDPDLPAMLSDAAAIWGVAPAKITVELTEGAIIEDKRAGFDSLLKIREMGINISIDDFGTGYSSLSYFKHIPAAELKIDKSFVDNMLVNEQDLELVKIILHIAHQFGLQVVAEGVEDRESLDMLRKLGCDYAQGYYLSEPLAAAEFEAWAAGWAGLDG